VQYDSGGVISSTGTFAVEVSLDITHA
jgi:hypothetical protein